MEIPRIYGFHFSDGVGRVTRVVRDGNIQAVKRRLRRVLLRGARAFPRASNVRRLCKRHVVAGSGDFVPRYKGRVALPRHDFCLLRRQTLVSQTTIRRRAPTADGISINKPFSRPSIISLLSRPVGYFPIVRGKREARPITARDLFSIRTFPIGRRQLSAPRPPIKQYYHSSRAADLGRPSSLDRILRRESEISALSPDIT